MKIHDNGGRRSGVDRRYYSYSDHIPEHRSENDRRQTEDRRQVLRLSEYKAGLERRKVYREL